MIADEDIANTHYAEHTDKPFFGELVEFITGGDLVALVLEGPNAVKAARQVIGATDPVEADAGSIRGEFGTEVTFNLVHGSDSPESAEREVAIWFPHQYSPLHGAGSGGRCCASGASNSALAPPTSRRPRRATPRGGSWRTLSPRPEPSRPGDGRERSSSPATPRWWSTAARWASRSWRARPAGAWRPSRDGRMRSSEGSPCPDPTATTTVSSSGPGSRRPVSPSLASIRS